MDLTFNKVAGAVLATGLLIVGLKEVSAGVFETHAPEKAGYAIAVAEDTGGGAAAAEAPIDWGTVLPTADVAAGEAVFAKCKSCHNADSGGPNGTGPGLFGVVGRKPATHGGFAYSPALTAFAGEHPVWTDEAISEFVKSPQEAIPGSKMTFVGLKKPEDRINVIAYLRAHGGTLAMPAPNPAVAAPALAEGAAPADAAVETGSTATPAPIAGGAAGQGPGAAAETPAKTGNPN